MKYLLILSVLLITPTLLFANDPLFFKKSSRKGKLYFYWGYNRSWYTKSDIHFKGVDYDITFENVVAKDRQTPFSSEIYFHPEKFTIPQYNFRIGYYLKDNWDISFGIDHMKYVVQTNQVVQISGTIENSNTPYNGDYSNDDILIQDNLLKFEHTDGLNYINTDLRRTDEIIGSKKVKLNLTEGLGLGVLLPKTNTTLLSKERYDHFHLSGYGFSAVMGLNLSFFDIFFVQSEIKGGFIHMPDIRTTASTADKANQHFFYTQYNIVFGALIGIGNKKQKDSKKIESSAQ